MIRILQSLTDLPDVLGHLLDNADLAERRGLGGCLCIGHSQQDNGQAAGEKELCEGHAARDEGGTVVERGALKMIDIAGW